MSPFRLCSPTSKQTSLMVPRPLWCRPAFPTRDFINGPPLSLTTQILKRCTRSYSDPSNCLFFHRCIPNALSRTVILRQPCFLSVSLDATINHQSDLSASAVSILLRVFLTPLILKAPAHGAQLHSLMPRTLLSECVHSAEKCHVLISFNLYLEKWAMRRHFSLEPRSHSAGTALMLLLCSFSSTCNIFLADLLVFLFLFFTFKPLVLINGS